MMSSTSITTLVVFALLRGRSAGVYVGLEPDVSKGYIRQGSNQLILCRLAKGPELGRLPPGSASTKYGHYAPPDHTNFIVVHQSAQLLPFAVVHF